MTDASWTVGSIKQIHNLEPTFLVSTQRVVVQTINVMIRGKKMIPSHNVTKSNPQGRVVQLCPTMYSPRELHPIAVTNAYRVLPAAPHILPTGYMQQNLEGQKLAASWYLPIFIKYATSRKILRCWRKIITQTKPCKILKATGYVLTSE